MPPFLVRRMEHVAGLLPHSTDLRPRNRKQAGRTIVMTPPPPSLRDRFLYMNCRLIGEIVEVHVKDGTIFQGIFFTASTENDFSVVLRMASVKRAVPGSNYELPRQSTLVISGCDFVQMFAKSIDVREDAGHNDKGPSFTDTDISRGGVDLANRGLERIDSSWLMAGSSNSVLSGLEDVNQSNPSHEKNWDQFEANKKLFGVESNFDESLYTTRLDKSAIPTEKQLEAAKLARGIEQTKSNNPHISEERGQGTALDEEALYGAVLRSEVEMTLREPQETRYIPPAHRSGAIGSLTQPLPWKPAASAGTVQAVGDDQDPEGNAEDAFDGSASEESAPDITDLLGDYDPTDRTGTEVSGRFECML